jgi:hypothetical protein
MSTLNNNGRIFGFFGNIGSGKTLALTRFGYLHFLKGYKVYANYHLSFPHVKIDPDFLEKIVSGNVVFKGNNIFLLDEIQMYIDSRASASKRNRIISYFIMQIRKKSIILGFTAQMLHTVEKRLRDLCQNKVECNITEVQLTDDEGGVETVQICVNTGYVDDGSGMVEAGTDMYLAKQWFKYYDTRELITI